MGPEETLGNENNPTLEGKVNAWEESSWVQIGEPQVSEPHVKVFNTLTVTPINNRNPERKRTSDGFQTVGNLDTNTLLIESWFWSEKDNREYPLPRWNPEEQGPLTLELKRTFEGKIWINARSKEEIEELLKQGSTTVTKQIEEKTVYA